MDYFTNKKWPHVTAGETRWSGVVTNVSIDRYLDAQGSLSVDKRGARTCAAEEKRHFVPRIVEEKCALRLGAVWSLSNSSRALRLRTKLDEANE